MNQRHPLPAKHHPARPGKISRSPPSARSRWRWLAVGVLAAVLIVVGFLVFEKADWEKLHRGIGQLNAFAVIGLMATLPLAGFSIGIFYLIVGAKFGPLLGGVVVAATTAIHLLAMHWIARSFLRGPLERFFARRKHRLPSIPEGENGAIAVMAALVPGLPYFARNYLLGLSGIPLRTYFWICLPIYVVRSYLVIFLGDLSGAPSRSRLILLGAIYAVKLGVCAGIIARLRKRHQRQLHSPTA